MTAVAEHHHTAGPLDRVESLPAQNRHVVGPLPLLAGRVAGPVGDGELHRVDEPAERRRRRGHLGSTLFLDGHVRLERREVVLPSLGEYGERLAHLQGVIADEQGLRGEREGHPALAGRPLRPHVVGIGGQFVHGQLRRRIRHRDLDRFLLQQTTADSFDKFLGLSLVAGRIDEHQGRQAAPFNLDGARRQLASGNLLEILQREAEFGEPLLAVLRDLLSQVVDEGFHGRIGDQLSVGRRVEPLLKPAKIADADPGPGGGGEDRLAGGESGRERRPGGDHE